MLHLRPSDYRLMPWKEGGGSTTEIAIARFLITRDTETSIPIDFPADSFH